MAGDTFNESAENQQNWAVRYGAEPIDFHMFGRNNGWDNFVEDKLGITAGIGGLIANHLYIEVGQIDAEGEFSTLKRIHGFSIKEDEGELLMAKAPDGRAFMMVIDGKHTPFNMDPIYQDDPHATKPNQLQHADVKNFEGAEVWGLDPDPEHNDNTRVTIQGTEREILEIYSAMVRGAMELNNQDLEYGAMGGENSPNGNSFSGELREKAAQVAADLGLEVLHHDPVRWNPGHGDDFDTSVAGAATWESLDDLRDYIDTLEEAAREQLDSVIDNKNAIDLQTEIPVPGGK